MWRYIFKRVLLAVVTIFIVIAVTFFLMNAIPGGPFTKEKAPDPRVQAELEERFHLNEPVGKQFLYYLENLSKGDFGISLKSGRDVSTIIKTSFGVSAKIGAFAAITALIIGLILGMVAALNRNRWRIEL